MKERGTDTPARKTLEDVLYQLKCGRSLSPRRRYLFQRASRIAANCIGKPASQISTDPEELRQLFKQIPPGEAKLKQKTIANVRFAVRAAIRSVQAGNK